MGQAATAENHAQKAFEAKAAAEQAAASTIPGFGHVVFFPVTIEGNHPVVVRCVW